MTAYVFFMIFCSLIGVAVGGIAVFGIFAIRRAIRNKKQEKESEKVTIQNQLYSKMKSG